MDGLRRRGGATTFLASQYLTQKKHELELTWRRKFRNSETNMDVDADNDQQLQLLRNGDMEEGFQDEYGLHFKSRAEQFSFWTRIVLFAAAATLAFNILVLIGIGVVASAVIGSIVSIAVGVVQLKLEDMETLREVQNMIRKDINKMAVENLELKSSVNQLTVEVSKLKECEERIQVISEEQGTDVESLIGLMKENGRILKEMKQAVRDKIILDLMSIAFQEERDQSGDFSDEELERVFQYMRFLPAVKVNEELLKNALEKDRSIILLLDLVSDIRESGVQRGDHIFEIDDGNDELQNRVLGF